MNLNHYEIIIIEFLYDANIAMTINEIATNIDISWKTTQKYLIILELKGYVIRNRDCNYLWSLVK